MTKYFNNRTLVLALALSTTMFASNAFSADIATIPVTATVQNAISLNVVTPMSFGTIYAIANGTQTASAVLSTASVQSYTRTAAPAIAGLVSGVPSAAEITVVGVSGATINLTINGVVNPVGPVDGDILTLHSFTADINGAGSAPRVIGTPFSYTATASDTILIGASLRTPLQASIEDGLYEGQFNLVASY